MAISSELEGTRCHIRIAGRFDFSCRADFRAAYMAAPTGSTFLVDLKAVKYVDSAALGLLLLLRDHAGEAARITISGSNGQPQQVLKIANFHKIFRFE